MGLSATPTVCDKIRYITLAALINGCDLCPFINIGDDPITNIRGSLYDDAGAVVGQTNSVLIDELPAKAHVWRNRNQLSDIAGDTWNGTASLKIDNPDENLRLLNLKLH